MIPAIAFCWYAIEGSISDECPASILRVHAISIKGVPGENYIFT